VEQNLQSCLLITLSCTYHNREAEDARRKDEEEAQEEEEEEAQQTTTPPHTHTHTHTHTPAYRIAMLLPFIGRDFPPWFRTFAASLDDHREEEEVEETTRRRRKTSATTAVSMDWFIFHEGARAPVDFLPPANLHLIDLRKRGGLALVIVEQGRGVLFPAETHEGEGEGEGEGGGKEVFNKEEAVRILRAGLEKMPALLIQFKVNFISLHDKNMFFFVFLVYMSSLASSHSLFIIHLTLSSPFFTPNTKQNTHSRPWVTSLLIPSALTAKGTTPTGASSTWICSWGGSLPPLLLPLLPLFLPFLPLLPLLYPLLLPPPSSASTPTTSSNTTSSPSPSVTNFEGMSGDNSPFTKQGLLSEGLRSWRGVF
jgi:hypothetical protein